MRLGSILLAVLIVACVPPVRSGVLVRAPEPTAADRADASITETDFAARIGFLAADALQGRDTPSPGLEAAAAWIASEFLRVGVRPGGTDGYLQRWPFETVALDASGTSLEFRTPAGARFLRYGSDFYVDAGAGDPFSAALVHVGRSLPAQEVREQTLRERLVVLQPLEITRLALDSARADVARAGAAGLVVVLPRATSEADVARAAAVPVRAPSATLPPVFFLREERAREIFSDARLDLDALAARTAPVAVAGVTARAGAPIARTDHRPANVIGVIHGSDPELRDTYVVFSAHYDHVGVAGQGSRQCPATPDDRICNGADDNASGTAAILELAEAFASLPQPPRRSLIFLAVSGEEKGLLGSAYFADNPTVPIERIVANVNIDMIGRNHPDSVVVIGQSYSSLGPLLHAVNEQQRHLAVTVSDDLWPEQRFFYRSDHFNFARREVPSIFFFTGVHEDYHRPTDTAEKVDYAKLVRITRLIFHYGLAIANDAEPPRWDPEGLAEVRRLTQRR
jgi:hypothetical protein